MSDFVCIKILDLYTRFLYLVKNKSLTTSASVRIELQALEFFGVHTHVRAEKLFQIGKRLHFYTKKKMLGNGAGFRCWIMLTILRSEAKYEPDSTAA